MGAGAAAVVHVFKYGAADGEVALWQRAVRPELRSVVERVGGGGADLIAVGERYSAGDGHIAAEVSLTVRGQEAQVAGAFPEAGGVAGELEDFDPTRSKCAL